MNCTIGELYSNIQKKYKLEDEIEELINQNENNCKLEELAEKLYEFYLTVIEYDNYIAY